MTVATGATAGPDSVVIQGSAAFPAGLTVAGPAIASQSPAGIAVGAPYGTVITLTGTGFTNTTTGVVTFGDNAGVAGTLAGIVSYVSPTTMDLVITTAPSVNDAATGTNIATTTYQPYVTLTQTVSAGVQVSSPNFFLTVDAAPAITGVVTYKVGGDVGGGAKAQTVYIHGTGFATGATVTKFTNGNGVADPDVTATVTAVSSTQITATIAVTAGDTNFADGYTVTNTDGGTATTSATTDPVLIGVTPTITSVSPTSATASATTAFTLTGTGFGAGAVVTPSSDGTCGTATVVSATSITVSCTLGAAGATAVTLSVVNTDGGTATSGAVLAAVSPAPSFRVTGAHGTAIAGKTVTITISGSGFYGQPHVTSTAAGSRIGVAADHGTSLTLRVTTKKGVAGEHTFTITLANGKSAKANYAIKK
ncbi:MAG: IPT/TIG domain-containing protein [Acidimicrobiales bacterium]